MPYIRKEDVKLSPPDFPDEWYTLRLPLNSADFDELQRAEATGIGSSLKVVGSVLVAWSHPEPAIPENVPNLDIETLGWLSKEILNRSRFRSDDEKKTSTTAFAPSTEAIATASQQSSGT